jgi:hypothetical protein
LIDGIRPKPDRRGHFPISIVKATSDPVGCPVLGEQIEIITTSSVKGCLMPAYIHNLNLQV